MGSRFFRGCRGVLGVALFAASGLLVAAVGDPRVAHAEGSVSLDDVPSAETVSLDAAEAEQSAAPGAASRGAAVEPGLRDARTAAQKGLAAARARLDAANAAYSKMMARNYPRGEAKVAIIDERDEARAAYAEATAEFRDLGGEVPAARAER